MSNSPAELTLGEVLSGVPLAGPLSPEVARLKVTGIHYDSRQVIPGYLFFAFPGSRTDGRRFAADAVARGAVAVASQLPPLENLPAPWILVEHGRRAMALACRNLWRGLLDDLLLCGITGTNGKTTTAMLVDSMLRAAGLTTALVGTIQHVIAGETCPATNTTPESVDLFRFFSALKQRGGRHVTMEVSSHSLALGRVYALPFHCAVFTNLSQDHLDFHGTMKDYFAAKQLLFTSNGDRPPRWAVINIDDPYGQRLSPDPASRLLTYGLSPQADVHPQGEIALSPQGLSFTASTPHGSLAVQSRLTGHFNVYNILAACAAGLTFGLTPGQIAEGIRACTSIPGRFETIDEGQPFTVIVDYAHTPEALRSLIQAARQLTQGRIITLFGCGGDRDRAKRPLMGEAAAELSDFVVLTSDNPRSEDPLAIIQEVLPGLRRHSTPFRIEPDRQEAIRLALQMAAPADTVLLAGKGHETYQILRDRTIPFDDRQVAREQLRELGYGRSTS